MEFARVRRSLFSFFNALFLSSSPPLPPTPGLRGGKQEDKRHPAYRPFLFFSPFFRFLSSIFSFLCLSRLWTPKGKNERGEPAAERLSLLLFLPRFPLLQVPLLLPLQSLEIIVKEVRQKGIRSSCRTFFLLFTPPSIPPFPFRPPVSGVPVVEDIYLFNIIRVFFLSPSFFSFLCRASLLRLFPFSLPPSPLLPSGR